MTTPLPRFATLSSAVSLGLLTLAACAPAPMARAGEAPELRPSPAPAPRPAAAVAPPARGTVRFVYLVSADRAPRADFTAAIAHAARGLQRFFASQLDGWTFALTPSAVEVVRSDKPAAWFTQNPRGGDPDGWGFQNALAEARRIFGAGAWEHHVWVLYSDGPGDKGRGGGGVAYLPEDDLLGLVGAHPTQPDAARWIAGGGHELGHALGLPHPPERPPVPNAIMGAGFYHCWPNACELTPSDRAHLRRSAFIRPGPGARERLLAQSWYDGGAFMRLAVDGRAAPIWEERKTDASFAARFEETAERDDVWVAVDRPRGLTLEVPRAGGTSRLSTDGGATWRALYAVSAPVLAPR